MNVFFLSCPIEARRIGVVQNLVNEKLDHSLVHGGTNCDLSTRSAAVMLKGYGFPPEHHCKISLFKMSLEDFKGASRGLKD